MIHLGFDRADAYRKAVPHGDNGWSGDVASQSPLNRFDIVVDGQGAEGTPGYLALRADDADQFYAESTPYWWTPSRTFDLRDTVATFYLKAIQPIAVAPGYRPHLFIDDYVPDGGYCGWYVTAPLTVGQGEWAFNRVELVNDPARWRRYSNARSLDEVLSRVGFIGVMYLNAAADFQRVRATGLLGWDEFRYDGR